MTITESLVLNLNLILEVAHQLILSLRREFRNAIFHAQVKLTDLSQFLITWCRHTEGILEAVSYSRIALKEIFQSFCQTWDNHDRIILPLIHLHKQLVERIYLIRVFIGQQFLDIIKKQDAILGFLDIFIPLVDEALIVNSIHHRQLRLLNNLMLIEIVTEYFRQSGLTRTSLSYHDSIHWDADIGNILTGTQIGIGVDNRL